MKAKLLLSIILLTSLFISCGPSAEEKAAREKMIADSVANAIQTQAMYQDSLKKLEVLLTENEAGLRKDEEDMNVANVGMQSIEGFQFLRTASEKEDQIRRQTQNIQIIRSNSEIHTKNIEVIKQRIEAVKNELLRYVQR
jgi:hypothetical protein